MLLSILSFYEDDRLRLLLIYFIFFEKFRNIHNNQVTKRESVFTRLYC